MSKKKLKPFDRYEYYFKAVQSPEVDCRFIPYVFRDLKRPVPRLLREDFCGTFAVCCEWVKANKLNRAIGIDLDPEPIAYGREHYLSELRPEQQKRVDIRQGSVITATTPAVDCVIAMNFSFYIFKSRVMLRKYFSQARKGLKRRGLFMVDCFGGGDCQEANMEVSKIKGFEYFWDQDNFNPITNEAMFYIHFKRKGEKKREKVFTYDWRMWTIPEIREAMLEAGFTRTHVYWEGTGKRGEGDGKFRRREVGDEADGWVAYVVGEV